MLFKFYLVVLVVLAVSVKISSQVFESIENASAQYFIHLSNKSSDAENDLINLKNLLFQSYNKAVCHPNRPNSKTSATSFIIGAAIKNENVTPRGTPL